jgi:hypothetical protein
VRSYDAIRRLRPPGNHKLASYTSNSASESSGIAAHYLVHPAHSLSVTSMR